MEGEVATAGSGAGGGGVDDRDGVGPFPKRDANGLTSREVATAAGPANTGRGGKGGGMGTAGARGIRGNAAA